MGCAIAVPPPARPSTGRLKWRRPAYRLSTSCWRLFRRTFTSGFQPNLELVPLKLGASVYEAGGKQPYVYFPTDSIVSLLYVMKDGASAEIAVVGNEGLVGISLFMGGETTPSRAVVQSAGHAYRLSSKVLKEEFEFGGALQHLLLRYTQALITQMAQTAVCNRHHSRSSSSCAAGCC